MDEKGLGAKGCPTLVSNAVLDEANREYDRPQIREFARHYQYLDDDLCNELDSAYDQIMGQLVKMMNQPDKWLIKKPAEVSS